MNRFGSQLLDTAVQQLVPLSFLDSLTITGRSLEEFKFLASGNCRTSVLDALCSTLGASPQLLKAGRAEQMYEW